MGSRPFLVCGLRFPLGLEGASEYQQFNNVLVLFNGNSVDWEIFFWFPAHAHSLLRSFVGIPSRDLQLGNALRA